MGSVALDADVVIAFLDASDDQHGRAVDALRQRLAAGDEIYLCASVYAEVIVRPLRRGADAAVDAFLEAINATIVPVDRDLARRAAALRARYRSLRLPDAFSLATAIAAGAELMTFDRGLHRIGRRELRSH